MTTAAPEWHTHPGPTTAALDKLRELSAASPFLAHLERRLRGETGTRLFDWVERMFVRDAAAWAERGYEADASEAGTWRHPAAMLPAVTEAGDDELGVAIRVESVVDFLAAHGLPGPARHRAGGATRTARISAAGDVAVYAVEQHGTQTWDAGDAADLAPLAEVEEAFRLRRRAFNDPADGFEHARRRFRIAADAVGRDRACDLFFQAEREYWQRRNRAARVQKARQDALGLGWANHDHHTYRSSRGAFAGLMATLEEMGFEYRERFYAGRQAGWGAQVLEQPACRVVIFADVDLAPDEVTQDFAREPLPGRDTLGTVGLWCALHGEAFFQAGMHHLEAQFDFGSAREQLARVGVESMAPFSDFPHLKQAFTAGERWAVAEKNIAAALEAGHIAEEKAAEFRRHGAIGSHLEILERNDGYKGFNQTGISDIIRETDPRRR